MGPDWMQYDTRRWNLGNVCKGAFLAFSGIFLNEGYFNSVGAIGAGRGA